MPELRIAESNRLAEAPDVWSGDWSPRMVAFDLDDTLAPSKSEVDGRMVQLLLELLDVAEVCVISGGQIGQFRSQLVDRLQGGRAERLSRLHLMPTCGTQYWRRAGTEWVQQYAENLTDAEIAAALDALEVRARELGYWETETWGAILENRGSQVTFSALGQDAPVAAKKLWDPTGAKKNALRAAVAADLPNLEVRSGGSTSIDITRRGIDKAYGIRKLVEVTGFRVEELLFVGDRLDPDGNDFPVKTTGVACHAVDGWEETAELVEQVIAYAREAAA